MNELWVLAMIYMFGVFTGIAGILMSIMIYLNPGGSVEIRCNDEIQ